MPATVQPVAGARRLGEKGDVRQAAIDLERLRAVALGVESGLRARAMVALAATDIPVRVRDLEAILKDESTPTRFRHLAAMLLGRIDHAGAREALMIALDLGDPRLIGQIAQSLGRIGDRAAFKPIVNASATLSGFALTQARFALRLLAYRFDLDMPDWPPEEITVLPRPGEDCLTFTILPSSLLEARIAASSLSREPFGIELDPDTAHEIRCDGSPQMLIMARLIEPVSVEEAWLSRKRLAGVVGRPTEVDGEYATALVMLTTPGPGDSDVALSFYQPTGALVLTGSASVKEKRVAFELTSVARRGAVAIYVKGAVTAHGIQATMARAGCSSRAVGHPRPR